MNGPPGPRSGLTGDNVAAARADLSATAKRRIKHRVNAKAAAGKDEKKGDKK